MIVFQAYRFHKLIAAAPEMLCIHDLNEILLQPPGSGLDLDAFQHNICSLNYTELAREITSLPNVTVDEFVDSIQVIKTLNA